MSEHRQIVASGDEFSPSGDIHIRWVARSHALDFDAKECCLQDDGTYDYYHCPADVIEPTKDFAAGDRYVSGSVKWDGCSHLHFGDGAYNPGYIHVCGGSSFDNIIWTLRTVFRLAGEHVPSWDQHCAGVVA